MLGYDVTRQRLAAVCGILAALAAITDLHADARQVPPDDNPRAVTLAIRASAAPILAGDAAAVAACESGLYRPDGTATLGTHRWTIYNEAGSGAAGAFQFMPTTWRHTLAAIAHDPDRWPDAAHAPPAVQYAAFRHLWADRAGAAHWSPSRSCWRRMLD